METVIEGSYLFSMCFNRHDHFLLFNALNGIRKQISFPLYDKTQSPEHIKEHFK